MFSQISSFMTNEVSQLVKMNSIKRHWTIPVMAAICVGFPMLIGLFLGDFKTSLTVSLGGLVILYLPSNENIIGRISKLLLCSFGFIISYIIGLTFSFNPWISCIIFGIFSACVYFITKMVRLAPPGNFFFIMIAAMASGIPFSLEQIPSRIGLLTLGTLFSCFIAFVFSILVFKPNIQKDVLEVFSKTYQIKDVDYVEAFIIGCFLSVSLLIAHLVGMNNPYWVPISCLAVMQGVSSKHIWQRGFSRILGTTLGMILCWVILVLLNTPLQVIIAIVLLQYIIENLIVKNYFFSMLFITPMTILLSEVGSSIYLEPNILILARLKDVLIGSIFGIVGGWVIYNEKLRFKAVKSIRLTRRSLKKLE